MPNKTALVIDDNRMVADELCRMLELLNIQPVAAYGSRAAIVQLGNLRPDLIFLDINMPGVTGFDVLSYVRREPKLVNIPVFVVSSEDQEVTTKKAQELGATTFLTKPLGFDTLEETLKQFGLL